MEDNVLDGVAVGEGARDGVGDGVGSSGLDHVEDRGSDIEAEEAWLVSRSWSR